jgi:hypothetical protein
MRKLILGAATALLTGVLAVQPAIAADPPPAKTMQTVFVSKGNASSLAKAVNESHAKMEAEGWSYADMGVYIEDGDLAGMFVTYVRIAATTPAP